MQDVVSKYIPVLGGNVEVIDKELMVFAINVADIPEWIKVQIGQDTSSDNFGQLTFFYHFGEDAVVLNRDHRDFDFYKLLVVAYLEANEKRQKELKEKVPTDVIGTALELLDFVIKQREHLNNVER